MNDQERDQRIAAQGFSDMTELKKSEAFAVFIAAQQREADTMQTDILRNNDLTPEDREKLRHAWLERTKIIGWVDEMLAIHQKGLPEQG